MHFASKAIIFSNNKYLLQLRDNKKNILYPNHWALFGGRFKKNESAEECLIREIREEASKMTVDFGRVRLDIIMLKARLMEMEKIDSDLEAKFKGNQTKEAKIGEKLKKKYGEGTVNIDQGVFIPIQNKDGES